MRKLQNAAISVNAPGVSPNADSYICRKSSEICKILPKSPKKAVTVLKHLWNQMCKSPRKRKVIDNLWAKDKEMGKFMYKIGKYKHKKNQEKLGQTVNKMKKKYKSLRNACRETDMQWSQFHKCTKLYKRKLEERKYIRKLNASQIKSIGQFFRSEDTSFPLPDKKYTGKRFMKKTLAKSCKMYNMLASTTRKICPSTFHKYKPASVKLQGKIPLWQSCCEVCQNFEFVLHSASKYLKGVPGSIDSCIDSSMCTYTTYFPKMCCAIRTCSECGVDKLELHLKELNAECIRDKRKRFSCKEMGNKKRKDAR